LATYYELMQKSPALSEEVMLEALNQYNLPNALVAEILAANPTAAKSDNVRDAMDSRPVPFDEWQREMVMAGATVMSEKEDLEQWMGAAIEKRDLAMNELFLEIWSDTLTTDKLTPMLALLDEEHFYQDLVRKNELLAGFGDYQASMAVAQAAPLLYRLTSYQAEEWTAMEEVLTIEEVFVGSGREALTESEFTALSDLYYTAPARAGSRALTLLIAFGGMEYLEPIIEDTNEPRKLFAGNKGGAKGILSVYPNPASDMLTVEWKHLDMTELQLSDLTGRVLQRVPMMPGQRQVVLQLGEMSSGMYVLTARDSQGKTHSNEVIKQ